MAIGVLLGAGLTSAVLALYFQKSYTIAGSSTVGAALISVGTDYFVENFFLRDFVWRVVVAVDRDNVHRYYSLSDNYDGDATTMTTTTMDESSMTVSLLTADNNNNGNNATTIVADIGNNNYNNNDPAGTLDFDNLFCWYTWIILAAWPALTLFGLLFQGCVSGKNYDHRGVDAGICGTGSRRAKRHRRQSGAHAGGGGSGGLGTGGGGRGGGGGGEAADKIRTALTDRRPDGERAP